MCILGAKFKFSVGHGKFNFLPLYAEIVAFGRIPIVSFAIETIIAVDLKKYHTWIILWRNFVYFSTVTRKNGFKKDRSARTDTFSWVCLISSSSLGRLELSFWVAGLGIAANSCKKNTFLQACHRRVDREIEKDWSYLVLTRLRTSSTLARRRTQPASAFIRTASSALSNSFSRAIALTLADNST